MFEDLLNALQNFRLNKTRTFLSLLGVIIGVASVIIITTIGESASANIKKSFGSAGLDLVRINGGFMRRSRENTLQFDEKFRQELWDNIENIEKIYFLNSLSAALRYGTTDANLTLSAVENGYLETNNVELSEGRLFTVSENVYGAQKIVIGSEIAEMLFPDGGAVGKPIIVDASGIRFGFEVIGVLKEQTAGMETTNNAGYIPRGFYMKKIKPNPEASSIVVQAVSQDKASSVAEKIEEYAEEKTGLEKAVNVMSMQTMLEQFDQITGTVAMLLSGVAAISLLVGGIGIMNIMIVTVTERRREIGIRKALGAPPSAIRSQFLVESGSITLIGGTAGIITGLVISAVVSLVLGWPFAVQWESCVLSFFFSAFVGVFFGLNPAARAAALDPVEALAAE